MADSDEPFGRIIYRPQDHRHECTPPRQPLATRGGTVWQCDCGRTWVAYSRPHSGELYARWRKEPPVPPDGVGRILGPVEETGNDTRARDGTTPLRDR